MKAMKSKSFFYSGLAILAILAVTYFIKIPTSFSQTSITYTPILALLIFKSQIVLTAYIILALFLIYKGLNIKLE